MKKSNGKENSRKWFFVKKRKGVYTTVLILLAVIFLFAFITINNNKSSDWNIVATVNNKPIYVKEFKVGMQRNRAAIYSYFKKKYGIDSGKDFWTGNYGGELPLNIIHKNTLDEQVRIKVQQILFAENGLQNDIEYKSFYNLLKKENKRREEAFKKNEVFFGPTIYNETEYFDYIFNKKLTELKEKLSKKELNISEKELIKIYEKTKDKLFKKPDYFKLQKISVKAINENSTVKKVIEKIRKKIVNKDELAKVLESYSSETDIKVSVTDIISDKTTLSQEGRIDGNLRAEAEKLLVGQVSDVFEEDGALNVIECIEREDRGYYAFDDIKEKVKLKYIDEKYEEYIDKLTDEAEVVINQGIYKSTKLDE